MLLLPVMVPALAAVRCRLAVELEHKLVAAQSSCARLLAAVRVAVVLCRSAAAPLRAATQAPCR